MKLSGFKQQLADYWDIVRINASNTYQIDTAYFFGRWSMIVSSFAYNIVMILFVQVMYSNVNLIAGYTRDEILFVLLVGQINYFLLGAWSYKNIITLVSEVNQGNLDLVLIRPLPALFYVSLKRINSITLLRDMLPPSILYAFLINWGDLHITAWTLPAGVLVCLLGEIAIHGFQFLLAIPVFWNGESSELVNLSWPFFQYNIPFEGYSRTLKYFFSIIIPMLPCNVLAASVMLGKESPLISIVGIGLVAGAFMYMKVALWNMALRNYTSASS